MPPTPRPERWRTDAGEAATAELRIPPDARRERRFELSVTLQVRTAPVRGAAWHQLTVLADGVRQWRRRVDSHLPDAGQATDGLDYRFLRPIKENSPKDYKRILEWFPLAELELHRMRFREEYYE